MEQRFIYHAAAPMSADLARDMMTMMEASFPPNERRNRAGQRLLLTHPLYRVATAEQDGRLVSFIAFWTMRDFTFLEHFATDPRQRGQGTGGRLLDWLAQTRNAPLVLEVELPQGEMERRRVAFYQRHGFRMNDRPYLQMPLREGDLPTPMRLMSWPDALSEARFASCRRDIYREVYGVRDI